MCQEQEALIRKVFDLVDGGMLFTVYHHTFGERLFEEPFTQPKQWNSLYSRLSSDRCGATPDAEREPTTLGTPLKPATPSTTGGVD